MTELRKTRFNIISNEKNGKLKIIAVYGFKFSWGQETGYIYKNKKYKLWNAIHQETGYLIASDKTQGGVILKALKNWHENKPVFWGDAIDKAINILKKAGIKYPLNKE